MLWLPEPLVKCRDIWTFMLPKWKEMVKIFILTHISQPALHQCKSDTIYSNLGNFQLKHNHLKAWPKLMLIVGRRPQLFAFEPFPGLLECLHDMVAGFIQNEWSKNGQGRSHNFFHDLAFRSHTSSFAQYPIYYEGQPC